VTVALRAEGAWIQQPNFLDIGDLWAEAAIKDSRSGVCAEATG